MRKLLKIALGLLLLTTFICFSSARYYKHKYRKAFQVRIPIHQEVFERKCQENPPAWMLEQIKADLSSYQERGISLESLDTFFQGKRIRDLSLVRFKIQEGRLSICADEKIAESRPYRHVVEAIKKLHALSSLPDVDFIISLEDTIESATGCPLFVFAKKKEVSSLVLVPDFKALTGYPTLRKTIEEGNQRYPWEKKASQAIWRGATTGGWLTASTWTDIPRCRLALLSLTHPQELDARITKVSQCDPDVPSLVQATGIIGSSLKQIDHLKYKYIVDVDGNSCSFERYFWALLSNSVVLKQLTPNIQWYYGALHPYEHFVPVREDLSDLLEQIQWVKEHDEQARQIAQNATAFVKTQLTIEDTFLYLHTLIQEYARIQKKDLK